MYIEGFPHFLPGKANLRRWHQPANRSRGQQHNVTAWAQIFTSPVSPFLFMSAAVPPYVASSFCLQPPGSGQGTKSPPPQQEAGSERRRKWPSQLNKNVIYDFIVCGVPRMNLVVVIRWVQ